MEIWHQKMGHVSMRNIKKLIKHDAIKGLPKMSFDKDQVCEACLKGKQTRTSHPMTSTFNTSSCFELLHMDLMGPIDVESFGRKKYVLVVADDLSRFTWVEFMHEKSETFSAFKKLYKKL